MSEQLNGLIKLRVDPPHPFTGKENFEEFHKRFRAYVILADPALAIFIDDASRSINREITWSIIYNVNLGGDRSQDSRTKLAQLLYYLLTTTLKDAPYLLLDSVTDSNGPEAWRLLYKRYAKNQAHLAMTTLLSLVNFQLPNDDTAETKFAAWENNVTKFERIIGKELYPEIKTGLVVKAAAGKLYDHLSLTVHDLQNYRDVKETIINFAKTRQLKHSHNSWDSDYMQVDNVNTDSWGQSSWDWDGYDYEVDAMWKKPYFRNKKGKGKGKDKGGKGKPNYKGDPKGKGKTDTKGGKNDPKGKGNQPTNRPPTGKWCTFHKTDSHNTSECKALQARQ